MSGCEPSVVLVFPRCAGWPPESGAKRAAAHTGCPDAQDNPARVFADERPERPAEPLRHHPTRVMATIAKRP